MLDARQCLLAVEAEAPDLQELAAAMHAGLGREWTQFVEVEGTHHQQPLHWRLLDGAPLRVAGSARSWRASLFPHATPGAAPEGFELCLTSETPLPAPAPPPAPADPAQPRDALPTRGLIGRDVAPACASRSRESSPTPKPSAPGSPGRWRLNMPTMPPTSPMPDSTCSRCSTISPTSKWSKPTTSPPRPTASTLADVARRAAGILGVRARERGIVVDPPRAGESLPAVAEFRRVLQVLLNLIGNAIRYSPANSQVWVRAESEDDWARIVVADQGPGLSAEDQARIFEKFERLGRSGDGGSGLGLYISRRLARQMGGELSVESAPGQGARFILDLPADREEARGNSAAAAIATPQKSQRTPGLRRLPTIPGQRA